MKKSTYTVNVTPSLKALTQGQACDLYELIESKYINSNFIITSNRKTESWYRVRQNNCVS